jgi:signal transduction histidine kinase
MDMTLQEKVSYQMLLSNRLRNRFSYLLQGVTYSFSVYIQGIFEKFDGLAIFSFAIFLCSMVLRWVSHEVLFFKHPRAFRWMNIVGYVLMAIGWYTHFLDVYVHYGSLSQNVNYTLVVIAAVFMFSTQSLVYDRDSYFSLLGTLTLGVTSVYLFDEIPQNDYLCGAIPFLFILSAYFFRLSHRQLRETVELKILSDQEKKRFRDLINTVPGIITIIDRDLNYIEANHVTLAMYPETLSQKVGYTSSSDYTRFVESFMRSEKQEDVTELTINFEGGVKHLLTNIHKTAEGGAVIVSTIMDELVRARKELKHQEAKAQYSAKLASLGQMAAGIAHEVNNPLTIIQGSANIVHKMVSENPIDVAGIKEFTQRMVQTCGRISKTIQSLKSLSRNGDNDPFTPVSMNKLLNDCANVCAHHFNMTSVSLVLPSDMPDFLARGREVQMAQVLINLLNNACDAVKDLSLPWVEVRVHKDESNGYIDVIDSGDGIPQGIRARIMEPFFTTKEVNMGTGLGLSISKTIMLAHDGELVLLENSEHTTFRMKFPLMPMRAR